MLASLLMPVLLLFQIPGVSPTPRPAETPQPRPTVSPDPREEAPVVVRRSVRTPSRTMTYTVTTGYMPIKNAVSGDTEARIFYMAYTLENPPAGRPLMFSFNGGPGSASVWLHLGALGPRRVKMLDDGLMPPPPYELVDNEHTWLSETDMVFIDPVGTGYSRAVRPDLASKFFRRQWRYRICRRIHPDVSRPK